VTGKTILGRRDRADFPLLGLENIEIKIDTGAFTSSIHCHHIEEISCEGIRLIRFRLLDPSHRKYHDRVFTSGNYSQKLVKSSFGTTETRFVIKTSIVLFGEEIPVELSLTERGEMKYPVLIGRKLLRGRFMVDVSRLNLSYRQKKRKNKEVKNDQQKN
jgi:hypothetical protein